MTLSPNARYFPGAAVLSVVALPLLLSACARPAGDASPAAKAPAAATSGSEQQRISYLVGTDLGRNLDPVKDELDIDIVVDGLRDHLAGKPSTIDEAQAAAIRTAFAERLRVKRDEERKALAAKNRQAGDAFLAANAKREGVVVTPSGLQYRVVSEGRGAKPVPTDTVRVNYVGKRLDGSPFESTYDTDHPAEFVLNQVMPGWTEGVGLMRAGSKYTFWIPPKLAYGENGVAGQIEPESTLVFEVELLEVAGKSADLSQDRD